MPGWLSGLQVRLVLGFMVVLALALAGVSTYIGLAADREVQHFNDRRDAARAARVEELVSRFYSDRRSWADLQPLLAEAGPVAGKRIVVTDRAGRVVADSHWTAAKLPEHLLEEKLLEQYLKEGGEWTEYDDDLSPAPVFFGEEQVGSFALAPIAAPPEVAEPATATVVSAVNRSLFWTGLVAAAVGAVLVWMWSRRLLTPLQQLGAAALRLGQGDFAHRAQPAGSGEIRRLAASFNTMAASLEEAERHRRELAADVAHELRTPLSNIQGYLEAMKDGVVQPTPEIIDTIHGQALHLSRLVEDLRLLALAESGALRLELAPYDVAELLRRRLEAVRPRAEASGVRLSLIAPPDLPQVELDGTRIAQVVDNLLENAVTHTPAGGQVTVSAAVEPGGAPDGRTDGASEGRTGGPPAAARLRVSIADTGRGIAAEDLPRLFDRFYRADPSRSRGTGGAGLGLTIARQLIEAHGGQIEAQSAPGQGSVFSFQLKIRN